VTLTVQAHLITDAELQRANAELEKGHEAIVALDGLQRQIVDLEIQLAQSEARVQALTAEAGAQRTLIDELQATIAELTSEEPPPVIEPGPTLGYMRVVGKRLLDAAGVPFLCRGVEAIVGPSRGPAAGRPGGLTDTIAATGSNAFRPNKFGRDGYSVGHELTDDQILAIFRRTAELKMVPYVVYPEDTGLPWFERPAVRQFLQSQRNLVIDALLEASGGMTAATVNAWVADAKSAITQLRSWGYKHPLSIHSIQSGRNLNRLLERGAELIAHDPEHNLLLGCQMYWPSTSWDWANEQGFGPTRPENMREAFRRIEAAPFAVQLGFATGDENRARNPYELQLELAAQHQVGWLWWDFHHGNTQDSLSNDGTLTNLTEAGRFVIEASDHGLRTAAKATGF
jgi:hypothetical protein